MEEKIDKDKVVEEWFKEKIENKFDSCCDDKKSKKGKMQKCGGGWGCFYFLTFIGAAIYYIQQADGFWVGVLGFLKALVWPVFMIYEVLSRLGM